MRASLLLLAITVGLSAAAADFAGPNQFICGTTTAMQANALSPGESGFWQVVQGTAVFISGNSPNSPVTGLSFGENVLQWTIFGPGGTSSDQVSIWCYDNASPQANAGADQTLPPWPGSIQLNGSMPTAPAACFWTIVSGGGAFSDPTDPQATYFAPAIGSNVLQWSCDNGPCGTSTDQVVIEGVVGIAEEGAIARVMRYNAAQHAIILAPEATRVSLSLYDERGRQLLSIGTPAGAGRWMLPTLPSGLYVVHAESSGATQVVRFVVAD